MTPEFGAATQLEIAMNKNASSAEVKLNMGAVQVLQGNYEEAYATLSEVSGSNDVNAMASSMKGGLEVRMAKYDAAKATFASAKMTDNAIIDKGLAYLLSNDYRMADAEFNQVERADAYYLLAVSSARQNNAAAPYPSHARCFVGLTLLGVPAFFHGFLMICFRRITGIKNNFLVVTR